MVHPLCLGGNVFGWTADKDGSFAVLDAYLNAGGNFIDTADVYSKWVAGNVGGESEAILGEWGRSRGVRDKIVIATKVGASQNAAGAGLTRSQIMKGCDESLRRLQTDYIDLYFAHLDDIVTPLEETLGAFDELVTTGKVRYIAASNFTLARLAEAIQLSEAHNRASFSAVQEKFNLVERPATTLELFDVCAKRHLGVLTYETLAGGFLTGKYRRGRSLPPSRRAAATSRYLENDEALDVLTLVDRIAARLDVSVPQIAIAWVLHQPGTTSAVASATNPDQLEDLLMGSRLSLPDWAMRDLSLSSAR
jgi:aryl-alcohol dehydrogenase (NADP+)